MATLHFQGKKITISPDIRVRREQVTQVISFTTFVCQTDAYLAARSNVTQTKTSIKMIILQSNRKQDEVIMKGPLFTIGSLFPDRRKRTTSLITFEIDQHTPNTDS